jgi:hypothetical protein
MERKTIALPRWIWKRLEIEAEENVRTLSGQMQWNIVSKYGGVIEKIINRLIIPLDNQ